MRITYVCAFLALVSGAVAFCCAGPAWIGLIFAVAAAAWWTRHLDGRSADVRPGHRP